MAIGIPAVCTATGNVLNFIEHEKDGILIQNADEWVKYLEELINNTEKRIRIGQNARKKFLEDYSQKTIFKEYLSVIEG